MLEKVTAVALLIYREIFYAQNATATQLCFHFPFTAYLALVCVVRA
jgi:hypothetical protein